MRAMGCRMAKASRISGLDAQAPVIQNVRLIATARIADLYSFAGHIDSPYNIRELHDLRIAAKRLRYTFEIFGEMLPKTCVSFVVELTQVQDELGALHDSDVMIALLCLRLASQDSKAKPDPGHGDDVQSEQQPDAQQMLSSKLVKHLLKSPSAPSVEQRHGLELLLQRQERLRESQYVAFRQHWYQLEARDFRHEMLAALEAW